jgi:hypothetical protein
MDRLNSHFLRPSRTLSRDVSGDGQSALVDKLGVSPSRSRLPGPHRYHAGIVQQAQGRSAETAVSPRNKTSLLLPVCGSTVLERTLAASHWRFLTVIYTLCRSPLNQPVAKPLPIQDNTTHKDENKHMP